MIFGLLAILHEGFQVVLINVAFIIFVEEIESLQDQIEVFLLQLPCTKQLTPQLRCYELTIINQLILILVYHTHDLVGEILRRLYFGLGEQRTRLLALRTFHETV